MRPIMVNTERSSKQCTDSVMDVADGVSVWFGDDDLSILKSFVEWYNNKWS